MRRFAPQGFIIIALLSCASQKQALIIVGESHIALGQQFVELNGAMLEAYDKKLISDDFYKGWCDFGRGFKITYDVLTSTIDVAIVQQDHQKLSEAQSQILILGSKIAAYAVQLSQNRTH